MPPRRRSTTIRRPRVAGLAPAGRRADDPQRPEEHGPDDHAEEHRAAVALDTRDVRPAEDLDDVPARDREPAPAAADPAPVPGRRGPSRLLRVPVLAGALIVLLALTVFFAIMDISIRSAPSASNTALVDVGATAEVAGQLGDALETIYSYDFARLDENERAAREVITPAFAAQFDTLFAQVRELAPQQQAVVSATVTHAAVQSIEGDRAVVVVFMDQQATRAAAPGAEPEQITSAGRITVTGERIDGRWKIADVQVR